MLDLVGVEDAQADGPCQDDVLRLAAIELFQVLLGASLRSRLGQGGGIQTVSSGQPGQIRRDRRWRRHLQLPHHCHRQPTVLDALCVDDIPADMIQGYGIGGEKKRFSFPGGPG